MFFVQYLLCSVGHISYSKQITIVKTVERKNAKGREIIGERLNSYNEKVFIVVATADEVNIKESALTSKEIRNAALRLIPQDIIDEAMEVSGKTLQAGVSSDMKGAKKAICDGFASIGVKPRDIEEYIGHGVDTLSSREIVDLRAVYKTISDGQATWKDYVDKTEGTSKKGPETVDVNANLTAGDPGTHKSVKDTVGKAEKK